MADIDREVAEKVMRFQDDGTLIHEEVIGDFRRCELYYPKPDGSEPIPGYDEPGEFWSPSTRMDHAWEVVEKLREKWRVEVYGSGPWDTAICYCSIDDEPLPYGDPDYHVGYAEAETAPLAICKAALAAVGEKG